MRRASPGGRTIDECHDGRAAGAVEADRGAGELAVRERERGRRGHEQRESHRHPHRRCLQPRRRRACERRVDRFVFVYTERATLQPEQRQRSEQDNERQIQRDDSCHRMKQLERGLLTKTSRDDEDGDDPDDVQRPDECSTGEQPRDSEEEGPADEPERRDTDDQEPHEAVHPEHALATLTTNSAPSCTIRYRFSRSGDRRRDARQRGDVRHRRRRGIRERIQRVLECGEVRERPREQEKPREREGNERA